METDDSSEGGVELLGQITEDQEDDEDDDDAAIRAMEAVLRKARRNASKCKPERGLSAKKIVVPVVNMSLRRRRMIMKMLDEMLHVRPGLKVAFLPRRIKFNLIRQ